MPYCKECGNEITKDSKFCKSCGRKLDFSKKGKEKKKTGWEVKDKGINKTTKVLLSIVTIIIIGFIILFFLKLQITILPIRISPSF